MEHDGLSIFGLTTNWQWFVMASPKWTPDFFCDVDSRLPVIDWRLWYEDNLLEEGLILLKIWLRLETFETPTAEHLISGDFFWANLLLAGVVLCFEDFDTTVAEVFLAPKEVFKAPLVLQTRSHAGNALYNCFLSTGRFTDNRLVFFSATFDFTHVIDFFGNACNFCLSLSTEGTERLWSSLSSFEGFAMGLDIEARDFDGTLFNVETVCLLLLHTLSGTWFSFLWLPNFETTFVPIFSSLTFPVANRVGGCFL